MGEKEFLEQLADVLNTETELSMDMGLDGIEQWDSLGALAFMGMCMETLGKSVGIMEIRQAATVRDLYRLL